MLTPRQNFLETIKGGNPDRFVKQYEFFNAFPDPCMTMGYPSAEGDTVVNEWGVTISWPVGIVTPYPIHDERHKVVGDITRWRDFVKIPRSTSPMMSGSRRLRPPKLWIRPSSFWRRASFPASSSSCIT